MIAIVAKKMPRYIQHVIERRPLEEWKLVPRYVHGIYCLLNKKGEVVYIGMVRGTNAGIRGRLAEHARSKVGKWTQFSVFQVWDEVHPDFIVELEGILRHIYRFDDRPVLLAKAKSYAPLRRITRKTFEQWEAALHPTP